MEQPSAPLTANAFVGQGAVVQGTPAQGAPVPTAPAGEPLLGGAPPPPVFYGATDGGAGARQLEPPPVQIKIWGPPDEVFSYSPPAETQNAQKYYGGWSTDWSECLMDVPSCLCMHLPCTMFCFRAWRIVEIITRTGPMEVKGVGIIKSDNVFGVACCVVCIEFLLFCGFFAGTATGGILSIVAMFFFWGVAIFYWLLYKGEQARFRIPTNDDLPACLCMFCCNWCGVLRMGRHADGYGHECGMPAPIIPVANISTISAQPDVATDASRDAGADTPQVVSGPQAV